MFSGMQRDYNRLRGERDEMLRAADRYREELYGVREELKGVNKALPDCRHSILSLEKENEHTGLERDQARADLEQAKALLQENYKSLHDFTREWEAIKAEMEAQVAKARSDNMQEYKDGFKDTMDYLFLMRDAVNGYKASIKGVDPTFDSNYYNRLISGEPTTPAPEDTFKALEEDAEQGVAPPVELEQSDAPEQPIPTPADQSAEAPSSAPSNL